MVLSKILGHAQPSITLNKYGHALPDHKKESMEKMRGLYESRGSASSETDKPEPDIEVIGMQL